LLACTDCGFENLDGSRFCGGCGGRIAEALVCPACDAPSPAGHHFCGACGATLAPDVPAGRDPLDYTPRHLAERILNSRSVLEGERKRVTVLFADVRNSAALAGELDPEAWHVILDRFFEILTVGVHRFDGTINQYTGDGIMALFGAPIAHEDHAQRACWAALELQQAMRGYGDELRREGINLSVRFGLNSGEVVVGRIGDDLRMDYTAQGHTVTLAQRAESLAEAGRVLLTSHTRDLVSGYFSLRALGETRLRGISERVELFELEGAGTLRTRLDASRAAGYTRFVGRTTEISQLDSALERALEGAGGVVGVIGEAGVGKSRLCEAFAERALARGVRIYEAHCPSHGRALSGIAARELVRSFCAVDENDSPAEARRKIAGTLVLMDPSFRDSLPLVFDFAGVSDSEHPLQPMDSAGRRRMAVAFLRELTRVRSERETAIFLFDDLHWIDPESDEFLADLITATHGSRTLVLANFRPEYRADWMAGSRYQQIALHPFGRAESEALLDELLGRDPSLVPIRARLLDQAGGNPFFTEELARSLIETGAIEGEVGARRLVAEPETIEIPETVHGVLAARIDRLPESAKRLLQMASVIGREFAGPVLEAVAELAPGELGEAIDPLVQGDFVNETQLFPHAEYRFKHALTQDVADQGLLRDRRRSVHGRTARALEAQGSVSSDTRAGEIAQHFELAREPSQAAAWYARAAEGTSSVISLAAGRYWRKVLETTREADDPEGLELRLRAFVRTLLGSWGHAKIVTDADALYQEGCLLAERLGDRNSQILLESAFALLLLGEVGGERAQLEHLERAHSLADADTPLPLRISLHQRLSWTHGIWGSALAAGMHAERGLELGKSDAASDARLFGYNAVVAMLAARAQALVRVGRLDEARPALQKAVEAAASHGDPLARMLTHMSASELRQTEEDWDGAIASAEAAALATVPLDSDAWRFPTMLRLFDILLERGAWRSVLEVLEGFASEDLAESVGAQFRLFEAVARMQLDPNPVARALAEEARAELSSGESFDARLAEARRYRAVLSRLLDGADAGDLAGADLDAALRDAERRSLRAFVPRIHAERAALAKVCGDDVGYQRALSAAIAISREIGAPRRAERYERDLDTGGRGTTGSAGDRG